MSDEELRRQLVKSLSTAQVESVDDSGEAVIEYEADRLMHFIKQHREAYAIEARFDEAERILGYDIFGTMQRIERTNDATNRRIAELREKVGRAIGAN